MNRTLLKHYTVLVDFLSQVIGPDYEIALHDLSNTNNSIVAIANSHISGRTIGAPLPPEVLRTISDNCYRRSNYRVNYSGISVGNKVLRSSSLYIKDSAGRLVGLLCINFDDKRYQELSTRLFQLCHPDEFVERNILVVHTDLLEAGPFSEFSDTPDDDTVTSVAESVIQQIVSEDGVPIDRLTQAEKVRIVGLLNQRGVFQLKGAVNYVARALHSSPASIYRYLSKLESETSTNENVPS